MSEFNFNKDYKFSPRVREIIEQRRGSKMGLTHAQTELMMIDVFNGKYKGDYKFTDEDKKKIMFHLSDFTPNKGEKENLDNFATFLKNTFTKNEIIDFVTDTTNRNYHPGRVVYNVRIFNTLVTYFISLFPEYFKLYKGIIINNKFVGDVKKIYPEVIYDEDTGELKDEQVNEKIDTFISNLISVHKNKIKISFKNGIYIIATDSKNELVINDLSTYKLNVEDIPEFYFKWE